MDVSARRIGRYLVLEVRESGPGIPAEQLPRVLEPFYRIPGAAAAGSGLGLSIVTEIARRTGGKLQFENVDGGLRVRYSQPI